MQDIDLEPAPPDEPVPVDPAIEGLYNVISELADVSIEAIEEAKKESTVLSYRMLIAGAIFGFLGSFFVATLLRWYDSNWVVNIYNEDFLLGILGVIAFVASGIIVYFSLKKAEQSKK